MRVNIGWCVGAMAVTAVACKDPKPEIARHSAVEARNHVVLAREGLARVTQGFVPVLEGLAPSLVAPLTRHRNDDVRFALMGMGSQQTAAGTLSFYPTGFIAAVGPDGVAIARNIAEPDDLMRGMPLATLFPSVGSALHGAGSMAVGELPPLADQPSRVYLVAATPVRNAEGAVIGALAAGISYGQLARALETSIRLRAGQAPVLWVGLRRAGRVLPSGTDRDVPARWLIPAPLIAQIPRNASPGAQGGVMSWTFIENGERGWGGALGTLEGLDGTDVLIYRSEPAQR